MATDSWKFSLGTGLGYPLTENTWLSLGMFYVPLIVDRDVPDGRHHESLVNVRAALSYRLW